MTGIPQLNRGVKLPDMTSETVSVKAVAITKHPIWSPWVTFGPILGSDLEILAVIPKAKMSESACVIRDTINIRTYQHLGIDMENGKRLLILAAKLKERKSVIARMVYVRLLVVAVNILKPPPSRRWATIGPNGSKW